ncbi:hypothetical protein D3C71_1545840 [compost metagenome]
MPVLGQICAPLPNSSNGSLSNLTFIVVFLLGLNLERLAINQGIIAGKLDQLAEEATILTGDLGRAEEVSKEPDDIANSLIEFQSFLFREQFVVKV